MNSTEEIKSPEDRLAELVDNPDLIHGIPALAKAYGLTYRQMHYALARGRVPGVHKVGGAWVGSRREMLRPFVFGAGAT